MSFEQKYYENEAFWNGQMLEDEKNLKRFELTSELIPEDVKRLVDVGCGNGVFLNYLHINKGKLDLLGVDRSEAALKFVKTNSIKGDISSINLDDRSFDCVTCLEVIEHLPVTIYEQSLQELARISDRYLIVSVPYMEILEESFNQCPSCKSIFNFELHLRRFSDADMLRLFENQNFKCLKTIKLGESVGYSGHYWYRRNFHKEQFYEWKSPICPVCGFQEEHLKTSRIVIPSNQKGIMSDIKKKAINIISWLPRKIWPKEKKYYWILALYERV